MFPETRHFSVGVVHKIKDVEDKFFNYINHDPHYLGGFLEEHYDNDDNLKDWYDEEFNKLFK